MNQTPHELTPAELAQAQADTDALAAGFPDTVESLLAELADDIPHRRAHAIAADYLARHRAIVLAEGADAINALPRDYECDPGRGDAAALLRRMATRHPAPAVEEQQPAPVLRFPQLAVPCPRCEAPAGQLCTSHNGTRTRRTDTHTARTEAHHAQEAGR
jgi:hypothetical protein